MGRQIFAGLVPSPLFPSLSLSLSLSLSCLFPPLSPLPALHLGVSQEMQEDAEVKSPGANQPKLSDASLAVCWPRQITFAAWTTNSTYRGAGPEITGRVLNATQLFLTVSAPV